MPTRCKCFATNYGMVVRRTKEEEDDHTCCSLLDNEEIQCLCSLEEDKALFLLWRMTGMWCIGFIVEADNLVILTVDETEQKLFYERFDPSAF